MSVKRKAGLKLVDRFRRSLEARIDATMSFYETGAIVCEETLSRMRKELSSVLEEEKKRFNLEIDWYLEVADNKDGTVTVRVINSTLN